MTIKARLLITIAVLIAAAFALIGTVTVTATRERMIDRIDTTLVGAADRPGPPGGDHHDGDFLGYSKRSTATIFYGPDGSIRVAEPSGFADDPDPFPALNPADFSDRVGETFTAAAADGSDLRFRVLVRRVEGGGFQVTAAPLDDVDATVHGLTIVIAATGLTVLAGVVLLVWLIIRRGLRPIDDMVATAGQIAAGDLSHRVEHADPMTEVGQLGLALNAMLARIEESFDEKEASERRLRQFVADASHELRTPLTSILGYAELYRSGAAATPEGLERVMARIESEGARMGKLVEDLLLLARLDQGRPLLREPVDLVVLLGEAVMDARVANGSHPITLETPAEAHVLGDHDRLRQMVDNLLTNARVHTGAGTPIHVTLKARAGEVRLSVSDEGPGIAPEEAAHVFDRFYRADPSRARARGGAGLGLSIVSSIVAAHAGRVTLESSPGQGATFTVILPRLHVAAEAPPQPKDALAALP